MIILKGIAYFGRFSMKMFPYGIFPGSIVAVIRVGMIWAYGNPFYYSIYMGVFLGMASWFMFWFAISFWFLGSTIVLIRKTGTKLRDFLNLEKEAQVEFEKKYGI